jgi:hypothetical protein
MPEAMKQLRGRGGFRLSVGGGPQRYACPVAGFGSFCLFKTHLFQPQTKEPLGTGVFIVIRTPVLIRLKQFSYAYLPYGVLITLFF